MDESAFVSDTQARGYTSLLHTDESGVAIGDGIRCSMRRKAECQSYQEVRLNVMR